MMKKYAFLLFFLFCAGLGSLAAQVSPVENVESESAVIDNFVLNNAVKMYPNPVRNFLTIHSEFPVTRVQIYSLLGDLVKDERGDVDRINMSSLNSGIYMIKIYSNQHFVTKKLIKK
ncbi:T9SS type A sorting domain-containing protein [Lutimonas sp.]|uniref:T9SS type A sorting domain-containing protein n=1 Tax=Lutimonas sp. TaxID=1872403 RepID=UPI003D9B8E03